MITTAEVIKVGNTAVVTGASSGIGRAAALEFCKRGMHVWLIDVDEEELKIAAELVTSSRQNDSQIIQSRVVDVADMDAVEALSQEVFASGGKCHFLMNNAGIGAGGGAMADMSLVHKVIGVNTYGPIHGCLAFVPKMKETKEPGIIVNTGSKQGITCPPGNLTYNMSKAALKCYTEGLEHELRQEGVGGSSLKAALLVPGWVNTSIMFKNVRANKKAAGEHFDPAQVFFHEDKPASGAWMPYQVVNFMIEELDRGTFYIICPDNEVDHETDKIRMTWAMQDVTENRPPLSRWHPEYKGKFHSFLEAIKQESK